MRRQPAAPTSGHKGNCVRSRENFRRNSRLGATKQTFLRTAGWSAGLNKKNRGAPRAALGCLDSQIRGDARSAAQIVVTP